MQFLIYIICESDRARHLFAEQGAVTGTHSGKMAAQSINRHGEKFGGFFLSRKPASAGDKRL